MSPQALQDHVWSLQGHQGQEQQEEDPVPLVHVHHLHGPLRGGHRHGP